jgi:hypothetical protein
MMKNTIIMADLINFCHYKDMTSTTISDCEQTIKGIRARDLISFNPIGNYLIEYLSDP